MWIITGSPNEVATSWERRSTSTSLAPTTFSESRALTPTMKSRFLAIASRAAATSARARSIVSPSGRMPARPIFMRTRPCCGAERAIVDRFGNAVGPLGPGINPSRHAVLKHERGAFGRARGMAMDVDQAGDHELAARVDGVGRVGRQCWARPPQCAPAKLPHREGHRGGRRGR